MEGDSFNSQPLSPRKKQKINIPEAKCLIATFLLGSFGNSVGILASYRESRVYSQKHEHMTTFEEGEQRTYTEQASAGTGFQTFPGVTCHGASSALLSRAHNDL